jgi:hypothetical protein
MAVSAAGGVLDHPREGVDDDEVAHDEGLVKHDGHRGKQIGQQSLASEGNGDAADPEASHEGGDVDPQVFERDE